MSKCDCGAKYTSNPDFHHSWCSSNTNSSIISKIHIYINQCKEISVPIKESIYLTTKEYTELLRESGYYDNHSPTYRPPYVYIDHKEKIRVSDDVEYLVINSIHNL